MKRIVVLAVVALVLAGCGRRADNDDGAVVELAQPADYNPAEKAAMLATFPAPYNAADLAEGEKQFGKCRGCHTITADKMNLTGPHLYGVFGRKSGTMAGYEYTEAMTAHNTVWDFDSLNVYLEAPQTVVKGTKMGFVGIKDAEQRRDLIAYLKIESTPRVEGDSARSDSEIASSGD